ncbi:hypothetical protein [Pseudarthrobacter sp. S9]|uniref:hypothetical protein n=1 Tax=Pseudarthrobacter sp. S9 TaxID=3418421 RepID=UPI003D01B20D
MRTVRLFDFIQFDGASWQVIAQDGTELALKNLATDRIRRVGVTELLLDTSYLPDSPTPLPPLDTVAALEGLDPGTRRHVEFLHRHVHEVLNGTLPDATGTTPEYDPAIPLGARIEAKLVELAAAGVTMTERTMFRHMAAYRKEGVTGLADGRTRHSMGRPSTPIAAPR